jgi:hypothetical protein
MTTTPHETHPHWDLASATRVFSCDAATLEELARRFAPDVAHPTIEGLVLASRHPTGWFVHAVHAPLTDAEVERFQELVQVRVFLLLTEGPGSSDTWLEAPDGIHWVSPALRPEDVAEELLAS